MQKMRYWNKMERQPKPIQLDILVFNYVQTLLKFHTLFHKSKHTFNPSIANKREDQISWLCFCLVYLHMSSKMYSSALRGSLFRSWFKHQMKTKDGRPTIRMIGKVRMKLKLGQMLSANCQVLTKAVKPYKLL